jgi:hypothetical protein
MNSRQLPLFIGILFSFQTGTRAIDWSPVDQILENAIANKAFPGCVAVVGTESGIIYKKAMGSFTYGVPPPNNPNNPLMTLDVTSEKNFSISHCPRLFSIWPVARK